MKFLASFVIAALIAAPAFAIGGGEIETEVRDTTCIPTLPVKLVPDEVAHLLGWKNFWLTLMVRGNIPIVP